MAEYDNFVSLAKRLIDKKGRTITIRRNTSATPRDASKPWLGNTISYTDYTVKGVITGVGQKYIDDNLVRSGDQNAIIPASGLAIVPNLKDFVVDETFKFEIIKVDTLKPGEQVIMYSLILRGLANDS